MDWSALVQRILSLPLPVYLVLALTLGLAPFTPPHLVEKLLMLVQGKLTRGIDWFDLLLHLTPWLLLCGKLYTQATGPR